MNPPRRDEETIFEVIEYDVKDLPGRKRSHYPKFDVRHYRVGITARNMVVIVVANKPVGKQLDETCVPIIPQLRQLLEVYASPFCPGELVFPDIFLNAVTDEQKTIRVHDYNRRISKNIKDVCESLGIQPVTPPDFVTLKNRLS